MPYTSLWCPCKGATVPLTHYEKDCPDPPMPLWAIDEILEHELSDTLHRDGTLTPTRLIGCPRETIIKDYFQVYLDPRAHVASADGVAMHERAKRWEARRRTAWTEVTFPIEGKPEPTFLGLPVAGRVDHLGRDGQQIVKCITDWKSHGQGAAYFSAREVKEELIAQLNIYRLIVKQVLGADPQELIAWHFWRAPGRALPDRLRPDDPIIAENARTWGKAGPVPAWFKQRVPVRNEAWIASVKPFGGRYTIGEIFDMYRHFRARLAEGATPEEAVALVPMCGESMMGQQKCSLYCDPGVRDKCFELAGVPGVFR